MESIHTPVLLDEVLSHMPFSSGMTVVDATFGSGGYSRAIAKRVGKEGRVIAFDADASVVATFSSDVAPLGVTLLHANFSSLVEQLLKLDIRDIDMVVADLGISSDQLEDDTRGLRFLGDGPLDMRLDRSQSRTAADIVATYSQREIETMLCAVDERSARSIARNIVEFRHHQAIVSTFDLVRVLDRSIPMKFRSRTRHFATKTFLALRMEVNEEKKHLEMFLRASLSALRSGGHIGVVSFHSGEDIVVKRFFRENARGCICPKEFPVCCCDETPLLEIVTKKGIRPSEKEMRSNARSRSAVLRLARKK